MASTAKKLGREVTQEIASVVRRKDKDFVLRLDGSELVARRATSCLVEPEPGDLVLVASSAHASYVLAVLEREEGKKATLAADGDLDLRVANGKLSIAAQDGIDLATGADASIVAARVNVSAVDGNVVVSRLTMLSSFVRAELDKVKLVATTFDSIVERVSAKLKRSYRKVEEIDHVEAEQIDYSAEKLMALRSQNAVVTAEELVKIDGDQVHMG